MDFLNHWLLTILIFLPSAGAILTLLVNGRNAVRWTAQATTIVTFLASLLLLATFDYRAGFRAGETNDQAAARGVYAYNTGVDSSNTVQMVQRAPWIKTF